LLLVDGMSVPSQKYLATGRKAVVQFYCARGLFAAPFLGLTRKREIVNKMEYL